MKKNVVGISRRATPPTPVHGRCSGTMMLPVPLDIRAVLQGACGMVVDTQSSAKSSNRTAGEVLQPYQLLKQGDELRQCSRLRHMIIRSTVVVHVPKLRQNNEPKSQNKES